jgi:hypothetical protein
VVVVVVVVVGGGGECARARVCAALLTIQYDNMSDRSLIKPG